MTFADFRRVQDMPQDWSEPLEFVYSQKWTPIRFRSYHIGVLLRRFFSAHPTYVGQAFSETEWVRALARRALPTDPPMDDFEYTVGNFLRRDNPNPWKIVTGSRTKYTSGGFPYLVGTYSINNVLPVLDFNKERERLGLRPQKVDPAPARSDLRGDKLVSPEEFRRLMARPGKLAKST